MRSAVAHLAHRSVRYLHAGSESAQRTLVLLHAFPLSADQWLPQLHQAPPGWCVVAPDLRGFRGGASESAEVIDEPLTIDDYARDTLSLMSHLGIERAVIGGLSMGGYVAFGVLRQAPARVSGLVLAHTRAAADTADGRANRDRTIELVRRDGPESVARAMLATLLGETTRRGQPDLVQAVGQMIRANTIDAIAAALGALRDRPDSTPMLASIACPTLVIAGEEDAIVPRAETEAMQRAIPGSRLVVLPRVGHLGNLEAPHAFSKALYSEL